MGKDPKKDASKSQSGQKKSSMPKPSPPRKTTPNRESNRHVGKMANANQIKFKTVGIDGVALGLALKSDGSGPAFMGNIPGHIENNESRMDKCQLLFFTKLRKPDGSDEVHEVSNKQGNMYPFDIAVFCTVDGEDMVTAVNNYAKTLTEISKVECRTEWKYGVPVFLPKGNATPPDEPPLSTYLLNADCVIVIKRVFTGCDTKTDLMNNEHRNDILSQVFGDATVGFNVIDGMDDAFYDNL